MRVLLSLWTCLFLLCACADLKRAGFYYSQGKYEKSFEELVPLLKKDFPEAYFLAGKIISEGKLKEKSPEEAIWYFEKAYELGYLRSAKELGLFYLSRQDYEKALKWFKIALDHGVKGADYFYYKTLFLSGKTLSKELEASLVKAASQDPRLYLLLGNEFYDLRQYQKAAYYHEKAFKAGVAEAGLGLARDWLALGREKEAEKLLAKLYHQGLPKAALYLGKLYEDRARKVRLDFCPLEKAQSLKEFLNYKKILQEKRNFFWEEALRWYLKLPDDPQAQYLALRIKWHAEGKRCGDYALMREYAKKNVREALLDLRRLYYGGRCPLPYGGYEALEVEKKLFFGRQVMSAATERARDPAERYYEEGMQLLAYNLDEARKRLLEACRYGSEKAEVQLALLMRAENPDLAGGVLYYYAKKERVPKAMVALAEMYLSYGMEEKALYWLQKAAELKYTPARRRLAKYWLKKGQVEKAVKYLLDLEKEGYCFASLMLGALYEGEYILHTGPEKIDLSQSLTHYRLAKKRNCPEAYFRLARLYYHQGRLEEALKHAKRFAIEHPEQIKVWRLLYKIYLTLGDRHQAHEALKKALELGYAPPAKIIETLSPSEQEKLKRYSRGLYFLILSKKLHSRDFRRAACYAYRAALEDTQGAALWFLRLGFSPYADPYFLETLIKNPSVCNSYIQN